MTFIIRIPPRAGRWKMILSRLLLDSLFPLLGLCSTVFASHPWILSLTPGASSSSTPSFLPTWSFLQEQLCISILFSPTVPTKPDLKLTQETLGAHKSKPHLAIPQTAIPNTQSWTTAFYSNLTFRTHRILQNSQETSCCLQLPRIFALDSHRFGTWRISLKKPVWCMLESPILWIQRVLKA